ncbi:MAG: hypothetical protein HGA47_05960, partial [Zoogloea sp.]|nr:hypothetical protein [Zoogloea sp.]
GALVAACLPLTDPARSVLPVFHGRTFYAALLMLEALSKAQQRGIALTSAMLAQAARIEHEEAERMLAEFRQAGWIARTEEGLWLLACRAERISVGRVCERFGLSVPVPEATGDGAEAALRSRLLPLLARAAESMDQPVSALFESTCG